MIECTPGSDNGLNQSFFIQLYPSFSFPSKESFVPFAPSSFSPSSSYPSDPSIPLLFLSPQDSSKYQESIVSGSSNSNDQSIKNTFGQNIKQSSSQSIKNSGESIKNSLGQSSDGVITRNSISSNVPRFLIENLSPGLSYTGIIFAWNSKGRSSGYIMKSINGPSSSSEKRSPNRPISTSSGSIMSTNPGGEEDDGQDDESDSSLFGDR